MDKMEQVENIIDNTFNDLSDNYHFTRQYFSDIEKEVTKWSDTYFDNNIHAFIGTLIENYKMSKKAKKISYNTLFDLYTGFKNQNVNVSTFCSDKNTMLFKMTTSAEILAISATLKSVGYNNEVIMFESLSFKIRFI